MNNTTAGVHTQHKYSLHVYFLRLITLLNVRLWSGLLAAIQLLLGNWKPGPDYRLAYKCFC